MAKYTLSDIFKGTFAVSQRYGANPKSYPMFKLPGHEGVDWALPNGTPVLAPFNGVILRDNIADKDYGNFTVIWDPTQRCAVWYCHLGFTPIQAGDKVQRGQLIGYSNNTGRSTGPHLHVNFVETDLLGNRLNTDNGRQGFLDILDESKVQWDLSGKVNSVPVPMSDSASKEQIVIDGYQALCGVPPTDDEKKDRLKENKNTVEFLKSLTGDSRFYSLYVKPFVDQVQWKLDNIEPANRQQTILIEDLRKQLKKSQDQVIELSKTPVTPEPTLPVANVTPQTFWQPFLDYLTGIFQKKS